ncbi:hypothetical protein CDAR_438081 [Caerostris darwini]|uniref:Uncharacterized protein n=1 Tax=Caerostris darwini TaxID=1538125 RepID=A0AAV4TDA0_9ARAC|nr:hypothetical protein CDAR_438081 [Caerostris darwini]
MITQNAMFNDDAVELENGGRQSDINFYKASSPCGAGNINKTWVHTETLGSTCDVAPRKTLICDGQKMSGEIVEIPVAHLEWQGKEWGMPSEVRIIVSGWDGFGVRRLIWM